MDFGRARRPLSCGTETKGETAALNFPKIWVMKDYFTDKSLTLKKNLYLPGLHYICINFIILYFYNHKIKSLPR